MKDILDGPAVASRETTPRARAGSRHRRSARGQSGRMSLREGVRFVRPRWHPLFQCPAAAADCATTPTDASRRPATANRIKRAHSFLPWSCRPTWCSSSSASIAVRSNQIGERVMRDNCIITVPAFSLLWGLQDDVSHHKRRYRLPELLEKLNQTNFVPSQYFYFNYLLFLPILATRLIMRMINVKVATEGEINTAWTNRVLAPLFRFDVLTAPRVRPPIGVSALVLATRQ